MTHFKVDTSKGICEIDILDSLRVRDLVAKAAGVKGIERGIISLTTHNRPSRIP